MECSRRETHEKEKRAKIHVTQQELPILSSQVQIDQMAREATERNRILKTIGSRRVKRKVHAIHGFSILLIIKM